nr:carbon starvation CstA family protein [uncultured Draconibacterium sp.]
MITFIISIAVLVAGYFIYGSYVDRKFKSDPTRPTPAIEKNDGVDYVPLKTSKIFLIQFLNIAGLGPIFGAIAGAMWGPVAFIWIVLGSVFAGGVHDYFSGMLSVRHEGESIPEIVGKYLGVGVKNFMRIFALVLLILVGVVFVKGPATILAGLSSVDSFYWVFIIFLYYILATMIPIDKLIGKVYPFFGGSLLVMALGIFVVLLFGKYTIPDLTPATFSNMHANPGKFPVFPMLFITIACGAISGFHSTQSPLMARCLPNEADGKKIFFGAMITEGIVALIWAAAAMAFFGGVRELGQTMAQPGHNAAWMVNQICDTMLRKIGGLLAIIGVVAAPITSGDTAFRSARLTIADTFCFEQGKLMQRLVITIPIFVVAILLTTINFDIIWRYFGWSNQTLATIVLWTAAVYMLMRGENFWIALIPAIFMTGVVTTYILVAPEGLMLAYSLSVFIGCIVTIILTGYFFFYRSKKVVPGRLKMSSVRSN